MLAQSNKLTRGKALEEAFFYQMDQELIELLSKRLKRDEKIRLFAQETGIQDQKCLEFLVDSGFELSTLTAFIWVPLVFVAWADGNADKLEKNAILNVLTNKGISKDTAKMMVAHQWFRQQPTEELWRTWEEFAANILSGLSPAVRSKWIHEIVKLCRSVALASGGVLGVGKISASEAEVINRVTQSLEGTALVAAKEDSHF